MYDRSLKNADHTKRFSITPIEPAGWEVREEQDSHVIRAICYDDWHRVERARRTFNQEELALRRSGWTDEQ